MGDGLTTDLWVLAATIGVGCALVAARDLPLLVAIPLAGVRVAIPLCYFAWYYDPATSATIVDDIFYVANARTLLDHGYGPLGAIFDPQGRELLHALSMGHHVLYAWWNLLAMSLFGEHYYSAVFLNVLATFVGAHWLMRMLGTLGFSHSYRALLGVFWLLHWDVVSWSSLLNVKDVLVQTLTIASFYCLSQYFAQPRMRFLAALAVLALLFWWIRFYIPLLILVAAAIWMLSQWNDARKWLLLPACAVAGLIALPLVAGVRDYIHQEQLTYGTVRFLLTPIPWNIQADYAFLQPAAVLHWMAFVPAIVGAALLWHDSKLARLCLIYLACTVALYAVTEDLLGPRQRFQVAFILAWAQFHAAWMAHRIWIASCHRLPASAPIRLPDLSSAPVTAGAGFGAPARRRAPPRALAP